MPGKRDKVENIGLLIYIGWKKYVRYDEGHKLYGMSIRQFMRLALDSGATRRIGRDTLVNIKELNKYIVEEQERERYEKMNASVMNCTYLKWQHFGVQHRLILCVDTKKKCP